MTKTRKKMVLSDEERSRRSHAMRERMAAKKLSLGSARTDDISVSIQERPAEVQAVLDSMDPQRRAKLEMIQARQLAQLAETREGQEALQRLEARHISPTEVAQVKPGSVIMVDDLEPKTMNAIQTVIAATQPPIIREVPMKVPFRLTGSISGQMISELGPCVCGEPKLKWHGVCLKVKV